MGASSPHAPKYDERRRPRRGFFVLRFRCSFSEHDLKNGLAQISLNEAAGRLHLEGEPPCQVTHMKQW